MAVPGAAYHDPVMVHEVLEYLCPRSGTIVDATVGGGGHARAILDALAARAAEDRDRTPGLGHDPNSTAELGHVPTARLLGIDRDPEAVASAAVQLGELENVELMQGSYTDIATFVHRPGFGPVTGVLFDLGVSLHQLVTPGRGFAFDSDGPIDMRFDQGSDGPTALELLRRTSERNLLDWLRSYGEEPMSGRVARVLHERRHQLRTTRDLAEAVRRAVPARFARKALARVFQALRIATNSELDTVRRGLDAAVGVMAAGGRLVVLSYHSLEDRIVKECFRAGRIEGRLRILTAKPLRPGDDEGARNPRARSARLRAAEVLVAGVEAKASGGAE